MSMVDNLMSDSANEAGIVASQAIGVLNSNPEIVVITAYAVLWLVPALATGSAVIKAAHNLPRYFTKLPASTVLLGVPGFVVAVLALLMHIGAIFSVLYWWGGDTFNVPLIAQVTQLLYAPWSSLSLSFSFLEITPLAVLLSAIVVQSASLCFLGGYNSVLERRQKVDVSDMLDKFAAQRPVNGAQAVSGGPNVLHLGSKSKFQDGRR